MQSVGLSAAASDALPSGAPCAGAHAEHQGVHGCRAAVAKDVTASTRGSKHAFNEQIVGANASDELPSHFPLTATKLLLPAMTPS